MYRLHRINFKDHYIQSGDAANAQPIFFFKDFIKVLAGAYSNYSCIEILFGYDVKRLLQARHCGRCYCTGAQRNLENLIASFIIFR